MSTRLLTCLALATAASAEIRFEDATSRSGIAFTLRNGASGRYRQVELMPGGVAAADFDNDGCVDLYFTNGAALPTMRKTGPEYHNRLYLGHCDLTFTDVTGASGVAGRGYSMGVAAADFDNDGLTDLYVAGVNANILYRNRSERAGAPRFEDVTDAARAAGIDPRRGKMWSVSPGWIDYDNDGRLDLFIANYLLWDPRTEPRCGLPTHRLYCHPDNYRGLPNQLLRNEGQRFRDVSLAAGIAAETGKGMGTAFADYDGDGFTDIFVANDSMRGFLFHNMSGKQFVEAGLESGVALRGDGVAIAGMGADFRDLDNDGWPDLAVTGMLNDSYLLFRNLGRDDLFEDIGDRSGVAVLTRQLTGWGMAIADFDSDGHKDLFFANAHFPQLDRYTGVDSALANTVLRNDGRGRFSDVSEAAGFTRATKALHRGAAFADFDNDGRLDVVVTALNGAARLWRNVTPDPGNWIAFRLRGVASNRDGLGARITVTAGGRTLHNHATTCVGYASSSERIVRFGLGAAAKAELIEIRWPAGGVQRIENLDTGRVHDIIEPDR